MRGASFADEGVARMKLGLQLGYWGAQPPTDALERILEAERLGFDTVFTAESWGSDAFGPLAWWGSQTSTIRLGTSIVQISARTPDRRARCTRSRSTTSRGGRFVLGLGRVGPAGGRGLVRRTPFGKPLARTREYVDIVRQVLAREGPVTNAGPALPAPLRRARAPSGSASRSSRSPTRCRPDLPIWLGAEGPKNVALTAEIADGWLPIYYAPKVGGDVRRLAGRGLRPTARARVRPGTTSRSPPTARWWSPTTSTPPSTPCGRASGFYIGGMGARDMNFHKQVFARMGYEAEAEQIQDLFFDGRARRGHRRRPAVSMAADISLVGSREQIRDELAAWEEAGVTMLVVGGGSVDAAPPHRRGRPRRVTARVQ